MSEVLNNSYLSLQSKKTIDVLTGVGIFGIIIFSILFLYFFSRKRKISKSEKRIIFIIDLFFSVVFGVIVTFIYNYPWFSIGFLVQLIFTVILFRKELVNGEIFFNQRESI
jgi:membrane-associated HD superfamily phosphohydrolase